jgi:general secretion pathway protein L
MARVVGIDLGSYSVKVVHIEPRGRGGMEVLAYGEALVPPPAEGIDAASSMPDRHSAALAELRQRGLLEGDVFITGLPGDAAAVRTLKFPFSDAKKIAEALPFALESEIPLDLDEIVLSWATLGARARKSGPAETEVLVAWARKDAVQNLLNLLAVHGIDPRHVEFDALALDDLFDGLFHKPEAPDGPSELSELRTPGGTVIEVGEGAPEPATAIVDIGHRRTTVCVLAGGRVVSAHSILHGGAEATRALSRAIGLPLIEAERGKRKEAFIEVTGARAQFPEQEQISEVLKGAYAPIVRRLRQVFQATISTSRVRVVKVILTGGGSRVLNMDRHLSEELNVKVARPRELAVAMKAQLPLDAGEEGAPEAALAFAYAMSGAQGSKTRARIDFRTGEFAWKGDFDFLREKAGAFAAWAAVLLLLLGTSGIARAFVLGSTEDSLVKQELQLCREITGQDQDSFTRCMALIQERINGQAAFSVPERSAADTYLEIARRLPPSGQLRRKITELDITSERVKMRGLTSTYEGIDTMVERLQGGRCFSLVEKGKAQNKGNDVDFNITITLDCAAAPGDGKDPPPPPPPGLGTPTATFTPPPSGTSTALPPPPAAVGSRSLLPEASRSDPDGTAFSGAAAAADGDGEAKRSGRLTPEEIEERRERLKKLREEREARRASRLGADGMNPLVAPRNPAMRDRFGKTKLTDPMGEDAEME